MDKMMLLFKKCLTQSPRFIYLQRISYYKYLNYNLTSKYTWIHYLENIQILNPFINQYSFQSFVTSIYHAKEFNQEDILNNLIKQYTNDKEGLKKSKIFPHSILNYIENSLDQVANMEDEQKELETFQKDESNVDLKKLVDEDLKNLNEKIMSLKSQIYTTLLDSQSISDIDELYLELNSGAGGQEAMLFVQNLMGMYQGLCVANGWSAEIVSSETTPIGGIRNACLLIKGNDCYTKLKFEGGIHRVQRIPKTEKAGRIHTSTASVAILPLPSEVSIDIPFKDLRIDTMRPSGPGGQSVNKSNNAIRITHLPTGHSFESQNSRSFEGNKKEAMRKLRAKLYEIEMDKTSSEIFFHRKLQVGTKARSEKIRTYNYPQDRVTDHRVGVSIYNIEDIISGGQTLEKLISELIQVGKHEKLTETFGRIVKNK